MRAPLAGVTHRIDIGREGATITLEVQGLVDRAAFAALRASIAAAGEGRSSARVILKAGTHVDRECLPLLRSLDAEILAESPYLARWIAGDPS